MRQLDRNEDKPPSLLGGLLRRLRGMASGDNDNNGLRETLEDLLEESTPDDPDDQFTDEERSLLLNALSFSELRVDDVMVPRSDIKAVSSNVTLDELIAAVREAGHSRMLVYRENLDDVVGIINLKDLLAYWGNGENFDMADVMRPVLVVPSSMRVLDLLLEMRGTYNRMASVVDEFGGTDGLVTIEDLIHEILGEIHDEHSEAGTRDHQINNNGVIEVDARIDLDDLAELLGEALHDADEHEEIDTLAGLIFVLIDRIPETGETVFHPWGWRLDILEADPRRIKKVRIRRAEPDIAATAEES